MRDGCLDCAIRLTYGASIDCHQQLFRVRGRSRDRGWCRTQARGDHVGRRGRLLAADGQGRGWHAGRAHLGDAVAELKAAHDRVAEAIREFDDFDVAVRETTDETAKNTH